MVLYSTRVNQVACRDIAIREANTYSRATNFHSRCRPYVPFLRICLPILLINVYPQSWNVQLDAAIFYDVDARRMVVFPFELPLKVDTQETYRRHIYVYAPRKDVD